MNKEEYIKARVDEQINWYSHKSSSNKRGFILCRIIEITCAAIIPLFAGILDMISYGEFIIGLLGIIIAICAGISSLFKFHENWIEYRSTSETLKHEKYLFLTQSGNYSEPDSFNLFVVNIEKLISKENTFWSTNTKENKA